MALKYTILKVILRIFSKKYKSDRGFTLIELIVGLSIMLIVSGLAMNALVEANAGFSKDKRNIESNQNMSVILEMIGNDIKQAGENISDNKFPVIKIEQVGTTDPVNMPGSSKITIRRALTNPLALCEEITGASTNTTLTVTDDSLTEPNCKLGTTITTATTPPITRPTIIKEWRNKRCQLDDVNGDYTSPTTADFCLAAKADPDLEQVFAAISDNSGHMRTFQYVNDTNAEVTTAGTPTITTTKYKINMSGLSADSSNTYIVGSPIYLIEERVYSLDKDRNFKLQRDGGTASVLIKRIERFNVSARVYGDKATKELDIIDPTVTPVVATNVLPAARRCDSSIPYYICSFNAPYTVPPATTPIDDWKTLAGIKVELKAKYDSSGGSATASATDNEKLSAKAEFFPRNVLSK